MGCSQSFTPPTCWVVPARRAATWCTHPEVFPLIPGFFPLVHTRPARTAVPQRSHLRNGWGGIEWEKNEGVGGWRGALRAQRGSREVEKLKEFDNKFLTYKGHRWPRNMFQFIVQDLGVPRDKITHLADQTQVAFRLRLSLFCTKSIVPIVCVCVFSCLHIIHGHVCVYIHICTHTRTLCVCVYMYTHTRPFAIGIVRVAVACCLA